MQQIRAYMGQRHIIDFIFYKSECRFCSFLDTNFSFASVSVGEPLVTSNLPSFSNSGFPPSPRSHFIKMHCRDYKRTHCYAEWQGKACKTLSYVGQLFLLQRRHSVRALRVHVLCPMVLSCVYIYLDFPKIEMYNREGKTCRLEGEIRWKNTEMY